MIKALLGLFYDEIKKLKQLYLNESIKNKNKFFFIQGSARFSRLD